MNVMDVVAEIRKIAYENPTVKYRTDIFTGDLDQMCRYVVDGHGSCIVGRALINLGITADTLSAYEYDAASDVLELLGVIKKKSKASRWIDVVQSCQDDDADWGNAVEEADTRWPILTS